MVAIQNLNRIKQNKITNLGVMLCSSVGRYQHFTQATVPHYIESNLRQWQHKFSLPQEPNLRYETIPSSVVEDPSPIGCDAV
jgi:hypothetical protein